MINRLVIENLKYRWVRTFLSALVVGVQVMLILTLIGLSRGLLLERAERVKGTGADIVLRPDSHGTISFNSGQMPEKFLPVIQKQPHVAQAVAVLVQPVELITSMNGVDIPAFEKISGGFQFLSGSRPTGPDDLLVDESYAREKKLTAGQTVRLLNKDWHLSGIVKGGMLARFVVSLSTLQELTNNPNRISQILIKLDDPSKTTEEVGLLNEQFKGNLQAISIADVVSQFSISAFPQLEAFIGVITVLAVIVGFLVVFLSMYTAVVERTREIGILKALGAQPSTILDLLVREAVVLSLAGWILGIGLAFTAKTAITIFMPASLNVVSAPDWWPITALVALAGALLGAIYPGLKAARQDAIEALAYE